MLPVPLFPLPFPPAPCCTSPLLTLPPLPQKFNGGQGERLLPWSRCVDAKGDGDGGFVFFLRSRSRQIPFCVPSALRAIGERLSYSHSANHKVVADFFLPEGWRVTVTHPPPSPSFRTRSTVTQHPCPTMACLSASFSLAAVASKRAAVRTKTR